MDYKKFLEEVVSYLNEETSYQDIIDGINKTQVAKKLSDLDKVLLARDVERYRYARLFGERVIGRALEFEDKEKRFMPLFYYSFAELSEEQVDKGIDKNNPDSARMAFVCRQNIHFTPDQINYILDDKSVFIRLALVQRDDVKLNKEQINKVLQDDSWIVFVTALSKEGISLTQAQMLDGLNRAKMQEIHNEYDNATFIRAAISVCHTKYQEFSGYDIESEVKHVKSEIRKFSINYVSVLLDNELKNNKRLGSSEEAPPLEILLRYPFAKIDPEYALYFLEKTDELTKLAFLSRPNIKLSDKDVKHILENKLESAFTKLTVINRKDTSLTKEQIDMLLSSEDSRIRHSVVSKRGVELTPKQVQNGLDDPNDDVRLAFSIYKKVYGIEAPVPSTNPTRIKKGV